MVHIYRLITIDGSARSHQDMGVAMLFVEGLASAASIGSAELQLLHSYMGCSVGPDVLRL